MHTAGVRIGASRKQKKSRSCSADAVPGGNDNVIWRGGVQSVSEFDRGEISVTVGSVSFHDFQYNERVPFVVFGTIQHSTIWIQGGLRAAEV